MRFLILEHPQNTPIVTKESKTQVASAIGEQPWEIRPINSIEVVPRPPKVRSLQTDHFEQVFFHHVARGASLACYFSQIRVVIIGKHDDPGRAIGGHNARVAVIPSMPFISISISTKSCRSAV